MSQLSTVRSTNPNPLAVTSAPPPIATADKASKPSMQSVREAAPAPKEVRPQIRQAADRRGEDNYKTGVLTSIIALTTPVLVVVNPVTTGLALATMAETVLAPRVLPHLPAGVTTAYVQAKEAVGRAVLAPFRWLSGKRV